MRERWEYTWSELDLENGLVGDPRSPHRETINERGTRGWEMVSVISPPGQGPGRVVVFFKRRADEA